MLYHILAFSPDGRRVAFESDADGSPVPLGFPIDSVLTKAWCLVRQLVTQRKFADWSVWVVREDGFLEAIFGVDPIGRISTLYSFERLYFY